jgi:putative ABC transport system ATP-binding protein
MIYSLKDVVKRREKGGNRFELQIPEFQVVAGEFVAIVGESGCGKSTLLDMLALIMRPTEATEFTLQIPETQVIHEIMALSDRQLAEIRKMHLGYVLQTGGLLPFLTVQDNVLLPCALKGLNKMAAHTHVLNLMERLRIKEQLTKKPQFLSGGQRQRVAIARALAHDPSIVLADEPTAAVDKITAQHIKQEFEALTRQLGVALIMVTHDERIAEGADRTFVFEVDKMREDCTLSICKTKH